MELTNGIEIDGSSRLAVEAPHAELGCGDEGRPIVLVHFTAGQTVSFERVATDASLPAFVDSKWRSAVRVGARRLRIACPAGSDTAAATLAEQRAKWEAAGIKSYEYSMFWGVFLGTAGDYRVTVVDGHPTALRRVDGTEVLHVPGGEIPKSIDEVFDRLERELGADRIDAHYHPEIGYPVAVLVDRVALGADDELTIRISDFTATG